MNELKQKTLLVSASSHVVGKDLKKEYEVSNADFSKQASLSHLENC